MKKCERSKASLSGIASDPARMGHAFKLAVEAGREAFLIGLGERLDSASATSPLTAFLHPAS